VVKGGHLKGDATDLLWNGKEFPASPRRGVDSINTHGTGCTSPRPSGRLARGQPWVDAIRAAKAYVTLAIPRASMPAAGGPAGVTS
jgi:hydroxymethylpyrimidine/phosphomethylpyrimidine kinase